MNNKMLCKAAALLAALALLLLTAACAKETPSEYKVLDKLDSEVFSIAFRSGDALRDIVSAALSELSAAGELSRLSAKWLGADYSCLQGEQDALKKLNSEIPRDRLLLVGVSPGAAPMSYTTGGAYAGLIPELAQMVCDKLGWRLKFISISTADVKVELSSGNVDCAWVCSSFDASSEDYSLSPGYMKNEHWLVVRRESRISRKSKLAGRPIAVPDDVGAVAALKAAGLGENAAIWTYDSVQGCFDSLDQGVCDALVVDRVVASYYMH